MAKRALKLLTDKLPRTQLRELTLLLLFLLLLLLLFSFSNIYRHFDKHTHIRVHTCVCMRTATHAWQPFSHYFVNNFKLNGKCLCCCCCCWRWCCCRWCRLRPDAHRMQHPI